MISVNKVELVRPPITVTPNPFEINPLPSAPIANGIKAPIVAIAVMRIGRSLVTPASRMASRVVVPSFSL